MAAARYTLRIGAVGPHGGDAMLRASNALGRALLSAMSLLMAPAGAWAREEAATSGLPETGEITLYQSPDRVLVMMRVADGDLIPMVFDTGSDGATIEHNLAKRLRMKKIGQVQALDGTTGKTELLPEVSIPDATVGGLKVGAIEAAAFD